MKLSMTSGCADVSVARAMGRRWMAGLAGLAIAALLASGCGDSGGTVDATQDTSSEDVADTSLEDVADVSLEDIADTSLEDVVDAAVADSSTPDADVDDMRDTASLDTATPDTGVPPPEDVVHPVDDTQPAQDTSTTDAGGEDASDGTTGPWGLPAGFVDVACGEFCGRAYECGRIGEFGGYPNACILACVAAQAGEGVGFFSKVGCSVGLTDCADFDVCLAEAAHQEACTSLCAAADACDMAHELDVLDDADACVALCDGMAAGDAGYLAALPCVNAALEDGQCDGMTARACLGYEPSCAETCAFIDGTCVSGDPISGVFADSAACASHCESLAAGPRNALAACLSAGACASTACGALPSEPAPGCASACGTLTETCPKSGFWEAYSGAHLENATCPWWCTGRLASEGLTDKSMDACIGGAIDEYVSEMYWGPPSCAASMVINPDAPTPPFWVGPLSLCIFDVSDTCESLCQDIGTCAGVPDIETCREKCHWIQYNGLLLGTDWEQLQQCVPNAPNCYTKRYCLYPCTGPDCI